MSIQYTYTFPAVEKNSADNTFITLHWSVTGVKGPYSSRLYGSLPAMVDPLTRNYDTLTYDTLYSWFQTFGDIPAITAKIEADIHSQEFPTIETVQAFRFTSDTNATSKYIQSITGNVLANAETGSGAIYHVNSIVVNDVTTNSSQSVPVTYTISNIGDLTFSYDGSYTFDPVFEYTGPVPVISFRLGRDIDAVIDSCILNISPVTRPFDVTKSYTFQGILDTVLTGDIHTSDYTTERVIVSGNSTTISGQTTINFDGNIGSIVVDTDGSWTFTPGTGYTGPIPVLTFVITDGYLKDTITLTILDIV